jgi:multisubunit Na+/H+ antiporter MnhG subunit
MRDAVTAILMWAGLAGQALAVLGVALLRDALDRVHYLGLSTLAALLLAAAVVVRESFSLIGIAALLLAAFVLVSSPVLAHVTARAVQIRRERRG